MFEVIGSNKIIDKISENLLWHFNLLTMNVLNEGQSRNLWWTVNWHQILVHVGRVGRLCISIIFYRRRKLKNPEKPLTHDKLLTKFITFVCIEYTSQYAVIQLTALVVIGTDFNGTCRWKFNYHMITAEVTTDFSSNIKC